MSDRELEILNSVFPVPDFPHFYEIISSLTSMEILLKFPFVVTVVDSTGHGLFTVLEGHTPQCHTNNLQLV